jgi:hypothetical protein
MLMVVTAAAAEDGHRPIRTTEAWQYIIIIIVRLL